MTEKGIPIGIRIFLRFIQVALLILEILTAVGIWYGISGWYESSAFYFKTIRWFGFGIASEVMARAGYMRTLPSGEILMFFLQLYFIFYIQKILNRKHEKRSSNANVA